MRIYPVNVNPVSGYQNAKKCNKPCGAFNSSLSYQDTFEKSNNSKASGPKQNLSFGWISLLERRRIKKAIGEKYYRPLLESRYFEVEYKKNFPGMIHVIHVHPECLDNDRECKKEIKKIQKTFIDNHSDRFSMKNFERTGFVCHGEKDLIMISTLAKKLKPYEIDPEPDEDWVHDHDYYE